MKITTRDFAAALRAAALVTERRNSIPILSTVAVQPLGDRMVARGTDLDIELTVDLCSAPKKGAFMGALSDPRALIRIMGGVEADEFSISIDQTDKAAAQLSADGFAGSVALMPIDDFPVVACGHDGWTASMPRSVVDLMIRVSGAMSTEETRYYLNGVYIERLGGWTYRMAATDGHRLYYADVQLPDASSRFPAGGVIIPRKAIAMLSRLRSRTSDKPLTFAIAGGVSENTLTDWTATKPTRARMQFEAAANRAVTMAAKLIDGTYPNISRVIPDAKSAKTAVTVTVADIRRAVGALAGGCSERRPALRLAVDRAGLRISAKYAHIGFDCRFDTPAEVVGEPIEIGFNGNYLQSVLETLACERVTLLMTDPDAPTLIADPDGGSLTIVLMPMRLS